MGTLIIKDFMILMKKIYFWIPLLIMSVTFNIVGVITLQDQKEIIPIMQVIFVSLGGVWVFILGIMGMLGEENRTDMMVRSLPISSEEIIKGKYIFSVLIFLFYFLFGRVAAAIYLMVLGKFSLQALNFMQIIPAAVVYVLIISIYLPSYYKFGYLKMKIVNTLLYMTAILLPNVITGWIKRLDKAMVLSVLSNISENIEIYKWVGVLILLLVFLTSMFLSINFGKYSTQ